MTTSDESKIKQKNSDLNDGDDLDTVFVNAVEIPELKKSMGGPIYMSVG